MSTQPDLTVVWMDVGPEEAKTILEKAKNIRNPSHKRVSLLAKEMANGHWQDNGETIKFDRNGYLVDGQHRLMAVIESGCYIRFLAAKGLPSESTLTVDTGQTRNNGQVLQGHFDIKEGGIVAAALRILRMMETGNPNDLYRPMSTMDSVKMYKELDRDCWDLATEHTMGIRQRGLLRACVYAFAVKDKEAAIQFAEDYKTGANLDMADPVYKLRAAFADTRLNLSRRGRATQVALTIKAWNARRRGKPWPRILSWRNTVESFPEVI